MPVTRDRNDDPVIDTAVRAKANYLCSIDKDIGAKEVVDHCSAVGVEVVSVTTLIAIRRSASLRSGSVGRKQTAL